jgi:2-hydroxymuconate-semialdehyde hydrolase
MGMWQRCTVPATGRTLTREPTGVVRRMRYEIDRAELSVLEAGCGEPVVLLHGIPTGAELWREVLLQLVARGVRGVAPDLPGYGQTRLPATADHSLVGTARLVARWIRAADLAPAWLVGHDSGGAVAQLLAVDHPDTVCRLTLVNSITDGSWPAPRARISTRLARLGAYRQAARLRLVPNPFMRWQVRRALGTGSRVSDETLDRVVWDDKCTSPRGRAAFERHLAALTAADTAHLDPALRSLELPIQIVWGLQDPFQNWATAGRRLRALLPQAHIERFEACGHFPPLECPEELVAALLDWRAVTA